MTKVTKVTNDFFDFTNLNSLIISYFVNNDFVSIYKL